MPRPLRSAFIATVSTATLSGCGSDQPILAGNPPEPAPTSIEASPPATSPASSQAAPPPPTTTARQPGTLNPRDDEGRVILVSYDGDGCFVQLPFPDDGQIRPPGAAPPSQPTACPPEMADPAYQSCKGGQVKLKRDGESCQCFVSGNPPRITDHPCPP